MTPRRSTATAAVWIAAVAVVTLAVVLHFFVRPQLADEPRVGSGRLDAPAIAASPAPVLQALAAPTTPLDAAALVARLEAAPRDGAGDVVALVVDASTGAEVYRSGGGARTPASSLKLLSSLVALDVLGASHRFATRTVWDGSALTLVGGGDPLLATVPSAQAPGRATLHDLAQTTASALAAQGVGAVALRYDAVLFDGPAWNPAWPEAFASSVAPITALTVDHARPSLAEGAFARHPDPARFAAERFAAQLSAAGIAVTGIEAGAAPAVADPDAGVQPSGATELGRVESLPVSGIVERVLGDSDNDAAETLLWQVALARGHAATPASGARVLEDELTRLGLWSDGMAVTDGNGIATSNQVTADALVGAVRRSLDEPALRAVALGLPVGGVTGTLQDRFEAPDAAAGRGIVRAKTGTIRGVNTLAGYAVTDDGHPLAFALMTSGSGQTSARAWLDGASAALVASG